MAVVGLCLAFGPAVAARYAGIAPAARSKTCSTRLASNVYRCTVIAEADGATFEDCFRFASPGDVSDKFDLAPEQLQETLGCTCTASGSPKKPRFGSGPGFQCTGSDYAFSGVVSGNGKKISKGFVATAGGASFAFTCVLDAACAL